MSVLPITQRVRNNIIRVLSDAYPQALSTPEVLAQLTEHNGCNHTFRRSHDDPRWVPAYIPHGCTTTPQYPCRGQCWHSQAYPSLRALHRQDSVEWIRAGYPNREARWRYTPHLDPDLSPTAEPEPSAAEPPYLPEIIDLDAPRPQHEARGQVINAQDRFTKATPPPQQHPCRECGRPGTQLVLPHVDHRRRKPWPQPYWLCDIHTDTSETSTAPAEQL